MVCGISFIFGKFSSTISLNHYLYCSLLLLLRDLNCTNVKPFNVSSNSWIFRVYLFAFCLLFIFPLYVSVCMFSIELSSYLLILSSIVAGLMKSPTGHSSSLMLHFLFVAVQFDTFFYRRKRWPSYNHIIKNQLNL